MLAHSNTKRTFEAISEYSRMQFAAQMEEALKIGLNLCSVKTPSPCNQTDEEFAGRALLKYITIYSCTTGKGCLNPSVEDIRLLETRGVEKNVFLLKYSSVDGLKLTVGVVPNKKTNSAEVRIMGGPITEDPICHKWLTLMNIN